MTEIVTAIEVAAAIEAGKKFYKLIKSMNAPRSNNISQPDDRKLFLQEFMKKCNSSSNDKKLARESILFDIKDFQCFGHTLLGNIFIEEHHLDEAITQHYLSLVKEEMIKKKIGEEEVEKECKNLMKNLRDVRIQVLDHTPYESVITFSFSSIWQHAFNVAYDKNERVVDYFKTTTNRFYFPTKFRCFEPFSKEWYDTGARYTLLHENAFFCGLYSGSVQNPIFCITSMDRSYGSKTDFGDLFNWLISIPLRERNREVMIIESIAGLVAGTYRELKTIPKY